MKKEVCLVVIFLIIFIPVAHAEKIHTISAEEVENIPVSEGRASYSSTKVYYYGTGLIAKEEDNELSYYHKDRLGSTAVVTDENGNELEENTYLPYGENLESSDETFGFTGKEKDVSGLIYFGARYYDSGLGGFITTDPIGDGINWYQYASGNPIKYVDPNGKKIKLTVEGTGNEYYEEHIKEEILNRANDLFGETILSIGEDGNLGIGVPTNFRSYTKEQKELFYLFFDLISTDEVFNVKAIINYEDEYSGACGGYYSSSNTIRYNPSNYLSEIGKGGSILEISFTEILIHELGHAYGDFLSKGEGLQYSEAFAMRYENYVRKILGQDPAIYYQKREIYVNRKSDYEDSVINPWEIGFEDNEMVPTGTYRLLTPEAFDARNYPYLFSKANSDYGVVFIDKRPVNIIMNKYGQ